MSPVGRKKMSTKTKGRLLKGPGTTVGVRCHEPLLAMLDAYRRDEPDLPTRATALRRLAIIALKASKERWGTVGDEAGATLGTPKQKPELGRPSSGIICASTIAPTPITPADCRSAGGGCACR